MPNKNMNPIVQADCDDIIRAVDLSPLRNKGVLLTGASGLFGRYIAQVIYRANETKRLNCSLEGISLHNPSPALRRLLSDKRFVFRKKDLSRPFHLAGKYDYIFHAAGYAQPAKFVADPSSTVALNVLATEELLKMAHKQGSTLLFFSSSAVYGEIPKQLIPVPESYNGNCSTSGPRAIYHESKRLGETICSSYIENFGVKAKIVRISHTYGPGISIRDTRVLGNFLKKALLDGKITLLDEGRAVKTFGYVADVVKMILYVALRGEKGVYNVGGKDSVSIRQLAEAVGRQCGVPVELPMRRSKLKHIGSDPALDKLDLRKILKEMPGFYFVKLGEGLARTIAWNKQEFHLK